MTRFIAHLKLQGKHLSSHAGSDRYMRLSTFSLRSYRRKFPTLQVAVVAMVCTSACSREDPRICGGLAMKLPQGITAEGNRLQITAACIERWAARLTKGMDSARTIADAAVGACDDAIALSEAEAAKDEGRATDIEKAERYWRREALFRAVQWRAGECSIEKAA